MRRLTIVLPDALYEELESVAAGHEMTFGPETWAQEAVESALATRRLPNVAPAKHGPQRRREFEVEDLEPEPYPVHFPHRAE
jgi:hypothetical protein